VTLAKNGQPVTGKSPVVKLIRRSDGKFYNWNLNVWQTPSFSRTLTENTQAPGVYETDFDQNTADPNSEEEYLGVFTMNGAPADRFFGTVEYVFRRIAAPGDTMALTPAAVAAVRVAIWTHVVDTNILGLTAEQTLDLVRKVLNNRLELFDGDTDNWKLYDDDDATILLEYNVRDKTGAPVGIADGAPARRTRGT
jgi:hypothetical protein